MMAKSFYSTLNCRQPDHIVARCGIYVLCMYGDKVISDLKKSMASKKIASYIHIPISVE